uniref:Uncharacterized protein n=1 Tax=Strigops habroptila TaxID=2489341 RepID=A0A672TWH9_STRHB
MASNSIFDSFATYSSVFLRSEYRPGLFVPRQQEMSSGFGNQLVRGELGRPPLLASLLLDVYSYTVL